MINLEKKCRENLSEEEAPIRKISTELLPLYETEPPLKSFFNIILRFIFHMRYSYFLARKRNYHLFFDTCKISIDHIKSARNPLQCLFFFFSVIIVVLNKKDIFRFFCLEHFFGKQFVFTPCTIELIFTKNCRKNVQSIRAVPTFLINHLVRF